MTLADLPVGKRARIRRLLLSEGAAGEASNDHLYRLAELGFTEGQEVLLLRKAPLGDPLAIRILGYDLCVRSREAGFVEVEEF